MVEHFHDPMPKVVETPRNNWEVMLIKKIDWIPEQNRNLRENII